MKKILSALAVIAVLASCSKKVDVLETPMEQSFANNYFRDANLSISFIELTNLNSNVKVDFATEYEKNITKIEVMSGDSPNYLCVISTSTNTGNYLQAKSYNVVDTSSRTPVMYYAIRYTLPNGNLVYTNTMKFTKGK